MAKNGCDSDIISTICHENRYAENAKMAQLVYPFSFEPFWYNRSVGDEKWAIWAINRSR